MQRRLFRSAVASGNHQGKHASTSSRSSSAASEDAGVDQSTMTPLAILSLGSTLHSHSQATSPIYTCNIPHWRSHSVVPMWPLNDTRPLTTVNQQQHQHQPTAVLGYCLTPVYHPPVYHPTQYPYYVPAPCYVMPGPRSTTTTTTPTAMKPPTAAASPAMVQESSSLHGC